MIPVMGIIYHTERMEARWPAPQSVAYFIYTLRNAVKYNELAVNPLGLTIVRFRADQAFE